MGKVCCWSRKKKMDVSSNKILSSLRNFSNNCLHFSILFSFLQCSEEGLEFNTDMGYDSFLVQNFSSFPNVSEISYIDDSNKVTIDAGPGPYLARWLFSPAVSSQMINQNLFKKKLNRPVRSFLYRRKTCRVS